MSTGELHSEIIKRLDRLNEYERQPVSEDKLYGGDYFAGSFAGEHVAATEFVIGALFVSWGASTYDVVVGLLIGNLLAVLSWTLICAPIAVQTRLTLYWYLRRVGGPAVMIAYNVLNAVLYCILAGCMITVAASAVRIPFGIKPQTGWLPTDPWFVLVVFVVGAVVVTLAILGFRRLAQFASVCSPWMLLMFVAGALVLLPRLGQVHSLAEFWRLADAKIWRGTAEGQANEIGFWHIVAFAWICNLAMHIGLSDMALFRYAKRSWYGLYSAFGMYLGHYLAWICAGIMGAAVANLVSRPLTDLDSGEVAFRALGAMGALAVVIAGWTTSNPTLYRAGLALQVVTPNWPRWVVTLIAGAITTGIACFPFVFRELLNFVGLYGLLLMPVGAIVVAEHWIFPRIGFQQFWSSRKKQILNWPAAVAWGVSLAAAISSWQFGLIHLFFLAAPVWVLTVVLYIVFAGVAGAREPLPEDEEPAAAVPAPAARGGEAPEQPTAARGSPIVSYITGGLALGCLLLCMALPLFVFVSGYHSAEAYEANVETFKEFLIGVTVVYFICGTIWMNRRERSKAK